jgi:hypothetical protein
LAKWSFERQTAKHLGLAKRDSMRLERLGQLTKIGLLGKRKPIPNTLVKVVLKHESIHRPIS